MGRANKVVLAYSGGVDTSVCIPYLKNEWGVSEVITLAADLGQGDELGPIQAKALKSGASESLVADATTEFVTDYAFKAIKAKSVTNSVVASATKDSDAPDLRAFAW
ncbi:MAG: argininosuccinate synthase domain-containing protein, partial [Cyanobacteria bacterium P01_G01_bin.49]